MEIDFSKTVFFEMWIGPESQKWGLHVYDRTDGENQVEVPVRWDNDEKGFQRFNLTYAMINKFEDWGRQRKVQIRLYVAEKAGGKILFSDSRLVQTGEPAKDIYDYNSTLHYRPQGRGNLGDVQPFYWRGEYHVFHMLGFCGYAHPWEHLVSDDLVHWREVGRAISGGAAGDPDESSCGSVSIIEKDGTFYLYYTGFNAGHPYGTQQVMIATSSDLVNWTKRPQWTVTGDGEYYYNVARNGPLPKEHGGKSGDQCFRDPYVWYNEESGEYWMAVFARDVKMGLRSCIGRLVSRDLIHWEARSPFINTHGMDCPDIFESGGNWYRLGYYSQYDISSNGPLGPYDSPKDYGAFHQFDTEFNGVPKRLWDGKRHVLFGWIVDNQGFRDAAERSWGGCLSIPREVYAGDDGMLWSKPVQEVVDYFRTTILQLSDKPELGGKWRAWKYLDNGTLEGGDPAGWYRAKCRLQVPPDYMLESVFRLEDRSSLTVRFREQKGDGASGYFVQFHPRNNEIAFGNRYYLFRRNVKMETRHPMKLQAFIQRSIIECFVNDAYAFTIRAYDYPDGDLTFMVDAGLAWIDDLEIKLP
jgi:beta-fructofuranosidase